MKDRKYILLLLPFMIANQSIVPFIDVITNKKEEPIYQFDLESDSEHTIVITNDSKEYYEAETKRKKFLSIEKRLAVLEREDSIVSNDEKEIHLGLILAGMSGGILYGEKKKV